jgi:hypothetical protein
MALDVHPPRAHHSGAVVRRINVGLNNMLRRMNESALALRGQQFEWYIPPPGLLPRLIVPGWSHLHAGQRFRGLAYLTSFLVLLVFSFLYMGTASGSILLGIMFSVHSTAALDVLMQLTPNKGMLTRVGWSFVVSAVLFVVLYLPVILLISQVAAPREMTYSLGPFSNGDVILMNPWRTPHAGQIVIYDLPEDRYEVPRAVHGRMYYAYRGERADRIIAEGGAHVIWEDQTLTIDGVHSPLRPVRAQRLPQRLEMDVPLDHYLIFPTTTPLLEPQMPEKLWTSLSLVPKGNVRGAVYFQTQPLSRFGRIK